VGETALRLDGITAGYGPGSVLTGVSLDVRRGEMLGVLGANGCGKTTLLRVASGVHRPSEGRVLLGGRDVSSLGARDVAREIAVLPQETAPVFPMSVLETVLLGRLPWRGAFAFEGAEDVERAEAALSEVDALPLRDRELTALSGGERQRVLLARALCQGGDVLLCDEPTAHLDLRHQASVFRILRALRERGRSVVVVTHDLDLAAQACDRLALLGGGRLLAVGTPREVLTGDAIGRAFGVEAAVRTDEAGVLHVVRRLGNGRESGR